MFTYLNNKIVKKEKAVVSIFDRGFLYGDGAFESLRTYNGRPFLLDQHIKRLSSACKKLKINIKLSPSRIKATIKKLMKKNKLKDAYIKIFLTRGEAKEHGLSIKKVKGKPLFIITTEKLNPRPQTCEAIIHKQPRAVWEGTRLKSLNYLEGILARMEAEASGADEAIFVDQQGNILEGTTCNIFIVKNETLITPPKSAPLLLGVTRNYVIQLAKRMGIKVKEKLFKTKELLAADECFITSSGVGIVPVIKVDGKKIGKGALYAKIQTSGFCPSNSP